MTMIARMTRRIALALLAGLALTLADRGDVRAQNYPERLIKLVVGYPPGGPIESAFPSPMAART